MAWVLRARLAIAAVLAWGGSPASAQGTVEQGLIELRKLDQHVADIGYRLARGSRDLCRDAAVPLVGLTPHYLEQYQPEHRGAAVAAFGLRDEPSVLVVAVDSAAARAGLRANDRLLAVDGESFATGEAERRPAHFDRTAEALALLERAFADGQAELVIARTGERQSIAVTADRGCPTRFQVDASNALDAQADGQYVAISSELVLFAAQEEGLAALLAHELAHNILRHRERLDAAGVNGGLLRYFGRNRQLVRATESEADQLSVYILDRAGYAPAAAARLWERMGQRSRLLQGLLGTHPDWKARRAAVQAEAARIATMKAQGRTPWPDFLPASPPAD